MGSRLTLYRPVRQYCQLAPAPMRRSKTADTTHTATSDISCTPHESDKLPKLKVICPQIVPGMPLTSSKSLPCYDNIEVLECELQYAPTAPVRSGTAPLPGVLRNLNPPLRRSLGTASHIHGIQEPCPILLEWEVLQEPMLDPAFRAGQL